MIVHRCPCMKHSGYVLSTVAYVRLVECPDRSIVGRDSSFPMQLLAFGSKVVNFSRMRTKVNSRDCMVLTVPRSNTVEVPI